jgi:putative transposase
MQADRLHICTLPRVQAARLLLSTVPGNLHRRAAWGYSAAMRFPETVTRRNLPHWYMPGVAHFVTYRLHGSLPHAALVELQSRKEAMLKQKPPAGLSTAQYRERIHKQLFGLYDQWLDQQKNDCLSDPRVASLIRSNLCHHSGAKYHLIAYCVMPNHVHVLFQPIDIDVLTGGPVAAATESPVAMVATTGEPPVATLIVGEHSDDQSPLARIMHSLKSYTAHEANKILKRNGTFWQGESYDHWVRDDDELERVVQYIRANPVKAGLVERPEQWFWCSCHDRFLLDGDAAGWLA